MHFIERTRLPALCLAMVVLSGCAALGYDSPAGPNSGRRAEEVLAQGNGAAPAAARHPASLREGIKLYDEGDFNGAIRRLALADVPAEPLSTRLTALKYTAFSYCVTNRPVPCRQAFDKALKLDPNFDLGPGEHSHPLWGPVFVRAKKGS
jgi:hypothetical protein